MSKRVHPNRWLWWAAFYALALGAGMVCLMYYTAPGPRALTPEMRLVATVAVVAAGICVISATSHWWLRR